MHLITQPVHVLPRSNLATKGNNVTNGVLYHDIAAQIITVSLLEPSIPDCRLPWMFSKRKLFLMDVGNSVKDDSSDHITRTFPVV
jgi:hypothetical protein